MRLLIYLIAALALTGCSFSANSRYVNGLDEAERLIASDPLAALDRLNGYDLTEMTDSATMARWALLYSEAMAAGGLHAPTDSIINIAIDYYRVNDTAGYFRRAKAVKTILEQTGQTDALASALYLQKEKEFMLYRERSRRQMLTLALALLAAIAVGVISWQRQRLKIKDIRNESLIAEASALRDSLISGDEARSVLECRLASAMEKRFGIIDELCSTYYESQGTKIERKAIADKVKSQIEAIKTDDGMFAEMQRCVNDCRDGLLDRLQAAWPDMRPDDFRLMVYLACRLSSRSIALLIGESIDVVYKRKSRLKAKISALTAPEKDDFLSVF